MAAPTPSNRIEERSGHASCVRADADLPPVAILGRSPITLRHKIFFVAVAVIGALAWTVVAFFRNEPVNAVWIVVAAGCTYIIGFRFYARLIEMKVVRPRDDHATPAEILDDGTDYVPTDRRVVFRTPLRRHRRCRAACRTSTGHPDGLLTQQHLDCRRRGAGRMCPGLPGVVDLRAAAWPLLGQMVRDELGATAGVAALVGIPVIITIVIAVLALVVVRALAKSPWGVFSIAMTIPIAIFMGCYLRFLRPGRVSEVSLIGIGLLLLAVVSGDWVAHTSWGAAWFSLSPVTLCWLLISYGFAASVLPVWLLLAPRDYLSTFMKVGTIALLAIGVCAAHPIIEAPAVSKFAGSGNGPVFAGSLFPFLFITIACGALSGFHALICSGTTPKMLEKEGQMRVIGYGGMMTESFVAVIALLTAAILDQHLYFTLNAPSLHTHDSAATAAKYVNGLGLTGSPVTPDHISQAAASVGEQTIVSRTGGAPTLAFGMAEMLHRVVGGVGLKAFWYHFAIMFEALFILTTVDAGTRAARFMISDALGNFGGVLRKLQNPSWRPGAWACSLVVVAAWGSILLLGVTDPLGGINTLFPLFGIANQLLAGIALTVITVVVIKKGRLKWAWIPGIPLLWDLAVTLTASWQKIFSADPSVGYWTQHAHDAAAQHAGETAFGSATNADEINDVVRNTFVQGTLSIVFVVVVVLVVVAGVIVALKTIRGRGIPLAEDDPAPSTLFAPAGLIPTAAERKLQRRLGAPASASVAAPD